MKIEDILKKQGKLYKNLPRNEITEKYNKRIEKPKIKREEWTEILRGFYEERNFPRDMTERIMKRLPKALEVLKSEDGKNVLEILLEEGETQVHKLAEKLNMSIDDLEKNMKELMRYALVYMRYSENSFDDKYLHYSTSKTGKKLWGYKYGK